MNLVNRFDEATGRFSYHLSTFSYKSEIYLFYMSDQASEFRAISAALLSQQHGNGPLMEAALLLLNSQLPYDYHEFWNMFLIRSILLEGSSSDHSAIPHQVWSSPSTIRFTTKLTRLILSTTTAIGSLKALPGYTPLKQTRNTASRFASAVFCHFLLP
jgi:hypothetical protein